MNSNSDRIVGVMLIFVAFSTQIDITGRLNSLTALFLFTCGAIFIVRNNSVFKEHVKNNTALIFVVLSIILGLVHIFLNLYNLFALGVENPL